MPRIIGGHGGQVDGRGSYPLTNVGIQALSTLSTDKTARKNGLFPMGSIGWT